MSTKKEISLIVPDFPIQYKSRYHKNFLPIGLLKISSYLRAKYPRVMVKLIRGVNDEEIDNPNEIWITSLFTYWSEYFWDCVKYYRLKYPISEIYIGGIYVSLHFKEDYFISRCKQLNLRPHFGVFDEAEKFLPDYSLIPSNPHPLDFQIIHASRGCPRKCNFCYTWKLEPKFTCKWTVKSEICSNRLIFYDNNLLMNYNIEELLNEISNIKYNGRPVRCESQSGFDGRVLEKKPKLASLLKEARFDNPRIAWDDSYNKFHHTFNQIKILVDAGYKSKNIFIFMLYNWDISFLEMEKKRKKCWDWKVQISDCRYRPINQLKDKFNLKEHQCSNDYYIHPHWNDDDIKQFRRNIRRQNICIRQNLKFYSSSLEHKSVDRSIYSLVKNIKPNEVKEICKDAWFPNE